MKLRDVIESVCSNAGEAHSAFHAGHADVSENYLMSVMIQVGKYFDEKKQMPAEVAEQVTSETAADEKDEQPAQVQDSSARPAVVDPSAET